MNKYLDQFKDKKVLIVGDVILDEYLWGTAKRLASDAPVPVVNVDISTQALGGAGKVALNIKSLGAKPYLCGLVGADTTAGNLMSELSNEGLEINGIIVDSSRPTTIKRRLMGNGVQLARYDVELSEKINDRVVNRVFGFVKSVMDEIDVVVLSDYNNGIITRRLVVLLLDLFKDKNIKIVSNPQIKNFKAHKDVDILAPGLTGSFDYCGFKLTDRTRIELAGKKLITDLNCETVFMVRAMQGISIINKNNKVSHTEPVIKKIRNKFGVRDVMLSSLALSISAGLTPEDAAKIVSKSMNIALGRSGRTVITIEDLKRSFDEDS